MSSGNSPVFGVQMTLPVFQLRPEPKSQVSDAGFVGSFPTTPKIEFTYDFKTPPVPSVPLPEPPLEIPEKVHLQAIIAKQEVTVDTPSQLAAIDAYIANLERQKQDLYQAVVLRQAKLRLEEELRVLEAKRQQELDDEESILALIL